MLCSMGLRPVLQNDSLSLVVRVGDPHYKGCLSLVARVGDPRYVPKRDAENRER